MGGTGVIDTFLGVFTTYIDSGFGLLGGEVAFIASTLIVIDVTLAALFWAWGADDDIIARLVKKTLFVGVFAFLISNWNSLAAIVFDSFAGLGLLASGTGFSPADLLRPGRVAQTGLDAGRPLLESTADLMGFVAFFENFIQIACLLFAWALVLLAFFLLAVQLFVTLIEFKLTTLAGFVLIPFGLFGKTAFMAERVLGNVVSSGIKVLVLAVIIGIGSTLFGQFTAGFGGVTPTIDEAMAIVLAALSLLGLGIFGPASLPASSPAGRNWARAPPSAPGSPWVAPRSRPVAGRCSAPAGPGRSPQAGPLPRAEPLPPPGPPPLPTASDRWARQEPQASLPVSVVWRGQGARRPFRPCAGPPLRPPRPSRQAMPLVPALASPPPAAPPRAALQVRQPPWPPLRAVHRPGRAPCAAAKP